MSFYGNNVLELAAELWNYDLDAPHFDGPGWSASEHYGSFTAKDVEKWLAEPHHGDCVKQPVSCLRCHAEEHVHNAQRLTDLGWSREIDPATCEHETVIRVKRVGDAWMQDFEDTPENWIREGRGHIVATVFCARCRQGA